MEACGEDRRAIIHPSQGPIKLGANSNAKLRVSARRSRGTTNGATRIQPTRMHELLLGRKGDLFVFRARNRSHMEIPRSTELPKRMVPLSRLNGWMGIPSLQ